jgi:pSer/pThr/pTyr-binding forkhead associated (FHA) protein
MPADADPTAPRLVPIGGGQTLTLVGPKLATGGLVIGRDMTGDVVIDNSTISKSHARVKLVGGKLSIEDLGSANGTWRGRQRIQQETFSNGDAVRFGSVEYRVEIVTDAAKASPAAATMLMSPMRSWMLSGFDDEGKVVQWSLQPTVDGSGREVETAWIVGRNSERADKVLPDKRISGEHAKIRFTPQRGLEICDLGSSNGTSVDGSKISDSFVSLETARVIEFGGFKMSLSKA